MDTEERNGSTNEKCAIICIVKNEGKYIREWVLYHFSIGVSKIIVYNNESDDDTSIKISEMSKTYPVTEIAWPSFARVSPQRSAYNDGIRKCSDCEWGIFIDADEFIVPWGYENINEFIKLIPADASAIGLNWRNFGSSNVVDPNYDLVIKTFTKCSFENWGNNRHIKTMARISSIKEMKIHEVELKNGKKLNSAFSPLILADEGKSKEIVYAGIQINHYQTKTLSEFSARMARGNANFPPGHPNHGRNGSQERFKYLDRNEEEDTKISRFLKNFDQLFDEDNNTSERISISLKNR